jgi:hypothetical protein
VPGGVHFHEEHAKPVLEAPNSLPAALADFTGRHHELDDLVSRIGSSGDALAIHAIDGMGGIGKTGFDRYVL